MSNDLSIIEHCPQSDREAIYRACRIVALADGRVWREADVLDRIGDRLGIPKGTRGKIHRSVKSRKSRCKIPVSDAGKLLMFEFAVQVASADDKLTDRELRVARRLGERLGVKKEDIEKRLARCAISFASADSGTDAETQDSSGRASGAQTQTDSLEDDLRGLRCGIEDAIDAERKNIFAHVMASPQHAARDSAERERRVPRSPLSFILPVPLLIALSVFVLVGIGIAVSPYFVPHSTARDYRGVMLLGVSFIGLPGAVMLLLWWLIRKFDAGPVTSRAAIVVGQHTIANYTENVDGWSSHTEGHRIQHATFMAENGLTFQHKVRGNILAWRLNIGDAGVLFLRRDWVVDFDCVLTGEQIREGQMLGALICGACETIYRLDNAPECCRNCGAELPHADRSQAKPIRRPYSPWTGWLDAWIDGYRDRGGYLIPQPSLKHRVEGRVMCGWCRHRYDSRPASPNCGQCGGPLPMPPGSDPGPEPPTAPRRLPAIFAQRLFRTKNLQNKVTCGMVAVSCLCFPLVLLSIPWLLWRSMWIVHGLLKARRRWIALARGAAVLGSIEYVEHFGDEFKANRNQHYRVAFRFEVDGELLQGVFETSDEAITKHYTGEPLWVLYLPKRPYVYATWPPFA